tara:strand:+ start:328 stop:585 length:258 start_codon:yes stop_codon:yes gene_type:complete
MWVNLNHLKEARYKASNPNAGYWWHFKMSIAECWFLLVLSVGSLIHAIFPFLLDFNLLKARIDRLKKLKERLPDDDDLKKVHFDD